MHPNPPPYALSPHYKHLPSIYTYSLLVMQNILIMHLSSHIHAGQLGPHFTYRPSLSTLTSTLDRQLSSISLFLSPSLILPLRFLPSFPFPCVFVSFSDYFSLYIFGLCFRFIFHTDFVLPGETHENPFSSHLVDRVHAHLIQTPQNFMFCTTQHDIY